MFKGIHLKRRVDSTTETEGAAVGAMKGTDALKDVWEEVIVPQGL